MQDTKFNTYLPVEVSHSCFPLQTSGFTVQSRADIYMISDYLGTFDESDLLIITMAIATFMADWEGAGRNGGTSQFSKLFN